MARMCVYATHYWIITVIYAILDAVAISSYRGQKQLDIKSRLFVFPCQHLLICIYSSSARFFPLRYFATL